MLVLYRNDCFVHYCMKINKENNLNRYIVLIKQNFIKVKFKDKNKAKSIQNQ